MKPLFYLLLVICFSTIFSCKKEKIGGKGLSHNATKCAYCTADL